MAKKQNSSSPTININTRSELLEHVENTLKENEYQPFADETAKRQLFFNKDIALGKQYAKDIYAGTTIYDKDRNINFLVMNQELFPDGLVIECRFQKDTGTVDEKFPYFVWNIIKAKTPTIIVIDGGGYGKAAIEWLKTQAHTDRALVGVYSIEEFDNEIKKGTAN